MFMHESSKGSLWRGQSAIGDCDQRYSESISLHAEQVGPARALSLNAILQPPTATVQTGTGSSSSSSSTQDGREGGKKERPGEEERTERRDETGLFHVEKGCVWRRRKRRRRRHVDRLKGGERRRGREEEACAIRSCLCLSVCLFSHSRNQFALRTVTVEQREKEACQVGHTQREMERDKTGTKRHGGV